MVASKLGDLAWPKLTYLNGRLFHKLRSISNDAIFNEKNPADFLSGQSLPVLIPLRALVAVLPDCSIFSKAQQYCIYCSLEYDKIVLIESKKFMKLSPGRWGEGQ
jgi:hypothetical protein